MISEELLIDELRAGYGDGADTLKSVSMAVGKGQIIGLVGANGAGKSTLLRCVMGLLRPRAGRITFGGNTVVGLRPDEVCQRGVSYLREGHSLFAEMTIHENLLLGAWSYRKDKVRVRTAVSGAYKNAPMLKERRNTSAGVLSGGQQRIAEIARLETGKPQLALLDEPSLGLAPMIVVEVFKRIARIREEGISVLVVDQNVAKIAEIADAIYVMRLGEIVLEISAEEARESIDELVRDFI